MNRVECKIILETWYQETGYEIEPLSEDFETLDGALYFLALNYESLLDDYPIVGFNIKYV